MRHLNKDKTLIILCVLFIIARFTHYYWVRLSGVLDLIAFLLSLVLLLTIFILLVAVLVNIVIKKRFTLQTLAAITLSILLYYSLFINPRPFTAEYYQSPIKYRGCFEGTMNTGIIYFRESGGFEYRHVGFMGSYSFITGSWTQHGDTLTIQYNGEMPEFVGDTLLITDFFYVDVKDGVLDLKNRHFYRGYCKGAN
ncbi:MAG: hypothetical protein AAFX87_11655 [Bacteroidota bacterium]